MAMIPNNLTLAIVAMGVALTCFRSLFKKRKGPLPPGPRGLPFIGSITSLPRSNEHSWKAWLKYKDLYGPISSVTVFGSTIVILHSHELVSQLFETRSSTYSSRAGGVFSREMVGWGTTLPFLPMGKEHRIYRKAAHTKVGTRANVGPFIPLQEKEVHRFLFRVLQDQEEFLAHIRTLTGAIILKMVYGYTVEPHKPDYLVELVTRTLAQLSVSASVGSWLVDIIPALRYVPEWVPGAGFKKLGREWRAGLLETIEKPLQFTRERMAKGKYEESYVADFGLDLSPEEDEMVKQTAIPMFTGGSNINASAIRSFFFLMTLHPEIQRRAQEEIDQVIGSSRLPMSSDRDRLPYIDAITKEVFRWYPVLPTGVPHATSKEDVVDGYYIPKGAVVIPNVWWLTHDPAVYPNPSAFDPSRFLGANPCPDPTLHTFGYGRRICPGRYFAYATVWLTIAQSLAVFDIGKGLDENGVEINPPSMDQTDLSCPGLITQINAFKATIKPRSAQHEALIRQVETLHPWEKSDADELPR